METEGECGVGRAHEISVVRMMGYVLNSQEIEGFYRKRAILIQMCEDGRKKEDFGCRV